MTDQEQLAGYDEHGADPIPGSPADVTPPAPAASAPELRTLVAVVVQGVFEPKPRFLVPVGGMVVGNAMTAAAVASAPASAIAVEAAASAKPKPRRRAETQRNPIQHVHFSSFIIQ